MGIWIELGIFVVILVFGIWQLYDVKKAIRQRGQDKSNEKASGVATGTTTGKPHA